MRKSRFSESQIVRILEVGPLFPTDRDERTV